MLVGKSSSMAGEAEVSSAEYQHEPAQFRFMQQSQGGEQDLRIQIDDISHV